MKLDMSDAAAVVVVVAAAVGFYFVGRYHEDYLKEKAEKVVDDIVEPPVVDEPGPTE